MPLLNLNGVSTDLPTMRILANGSELGGEFAVQTAFTHKAFNKIGTARLIIQDGSVADRDFAASNASELAPGAEIEIKLGYSGDEITAFKGIITRHALRSQPDGPSLLEITLKDAAFKATIGRRNRYFYELSDTEIINEIAAEYGLTSDTAETAVVHAEMVQYNATDWDFLVTRAEANGMLVCPDDGEIRCIVPSTTTSPVADLTYGDNIVDFETEMDPRYQFDAVVARAWDPANQEVLEIDSTPPGIEDPGNLSSTDLAAIVGLDGFHLQHSGRLQSEELQAWSNARHVRSNLARVQGRLRILGSADIRPGDVVNLAGLGDRFSGPAFVSGVAHAFGTGTKWFTDLYVGLAHTTHHDNYDDIEDHPCGGLLPGIGGLQIGIVTAIEDPLGEERIQVRLPVLDPAGDGVWARQSTLDAGNNRGSVFRPEVGDEVVVGFLNDDPRHPVMLGMLHSSAHPAPIAPTSENVEKGFVTKNEMKIVFNDEDVSITIETPRGNKILLSEQDGAISITDENGNAIVMDSNGITYDSPGDIVIKSQGDVSIEGTNIEIKAQASLKASGNSGAELSSSATAVLKGSLVQIN